MRLQLAFRAVGVVLILLLGYVIWTKHSPPPGLHDPVFRQQLTELAAEMECDQSQDVSAVLESTTTIRAHVTRELNAILQVNARRLTAQQLTLLQNASEKLAAMQLEINLIASGQDTQVTYREYLDDFAAARTKIVQAASTI